MHNRRIHGSMERHCKVCQAAFSHAHMQQDSLHFGMQHASHLLWVPVRAHLWHRQRATSLARYRWLRYTDQSLHVQLVSFNTEACSSSKTYQDGFAALVEARAYLHLFVKCSSLEKQAGCKAAMLCVKQCICHSRKYLQ